MAVQITIPVQDDWDLLDIRERGIRGGDSSPEEEFAVDTSNATRHFSCLWSQRKTAFKNFLGYSQLYTDSGVVKLSRLMPEKHPNFAGLIATQIFDIKGHQFTGDTVEVAEDDPYRSDPTRCFDHPDYRYVPSTTVNLYERCLFSVKYEQAPYVANMIDEDVPSSGTDESARYVSDDSCDFSAQALTMPGSCFKYFKSGGGGPSGVAVSSNFSRIEPLSVVKKTWWRLPEDAFDDSGASGLYARIFGTGSTRGLLGTVNKTTFFGLAPGKVLFSAVRPQRKKSPLGTGLEWNLEMEFTVKTNSLWNELFYFDPASTNSGYYFVTSTGGFQAAGSVTDDTSLYSERDLNTIFNVAL